MFCSRLNKGDIQQQQQSLESRRFFAMIMINHHFPDSRPRPQKCYEEAPRSFVLKSCSSLMKGSWVRKKRGVASHKFVTSFLDSSLCPLCDKSFAIHVWGCPCRNVIESYYLDKFKAWIFDCFSNLHQSYQFRNWPIYLFW